MHSGTVGSGQCKVATNKGGTQSVRSGNIEDELRRGRKIPLSWDALVAERGGGEGFLSRRVGQIKGKMR